jgi:hypothetical protein
MKLFGVLQNFQNLPVFEIEQPQLFIILIGEKSQND